MQGSVPHPSSSPSSRDRSSHCRRDWHPGRPEIALQNARVKMRRSSRSNVAGIHTAATTDILHALRNHVHFYLGAWGGKAILRRDLRSNFENTGYKLLKSRRLGSQRQLVIGAPPHPGLSVPLRPDLETPSLPQGGI